MSAKKIARRTGASNDVASYLAAPYVRMLIPNAEEGGYLAEVLELPGCITEGETPEEAYRNVEEAMAGWIGASLDANRPIPEPVGAKEYSGNFPLRISTELHRAAALRAVQEQVSLNQWIARAIAAQVARESLVENLADEVAGRVLEGLSLQVEAGVRLQLRGLETAASRSSDVLAVKVEPIAGEAFSDTPASAYISVLRVLQDRYGSLGQIEEVEQRKEVIKDA